jgi:hypothetical protein
MKKSIFVSYSRADNEETNWVARLKLYLAPLRRAGVLDTWDDSRIETGENWREAIENALNDTSAAVLIVGPGFLASDFIMNHELPNLLAAAEKKGTAIYPLVVGYCGYKSSELEKYQAANDPEHPLESLPKHEQNRILNELAKSIDKSYQKNEILESKNEDLKTVEYLGIVQEVERILADTKTAFLAQIRRREALVEMLERRLRMHNTLQFEKFFFKYFSELTDDERFEFEQIRAMTEGPLCTGNRRIVQLIDQNPRLIEEIPGLMDLRQHLVFWLNKYDRVFIKNKAMCLLYTGVEDGVPFPSYVQDSIDNWMKEQRDTTKPSS